MLGAAGVQIPEKNLDDLHSSREEDGTSKTMDPQDLLEVSVDFVIRSATCSTGFTPVEDNIGLLETRFDEEAVFMFVFPGM
ncbi:hypothetical protein Tco_0496341 [Tanacetum coccineum]